MKTILIQKTNLRWPWAKYECYECPGAWYWRHPWTTSHYNPNAGPAEIRWITPMLMNMSERSGDILKWLGNPTVEWVEDDVWNRHI